MCSSDLVFMGGRADSMNQDFKAATTLLDAITDLLNWTTVNQRNLAPSSADELCSHLMPLINTVCNLSLFERFLSCDSETGACHSSVGASLSQLISTPGIVAFTTIPEALQAAKEPKAKPRPRHAPGNTARPPPVPHSMRPPRSTPSKLTTAHAENDSCPQAWTPVLNKRKAPNQEEAIIALAKTFSASTSVMIQQAAATIARSSSSGGSYNDRKVKIRKSTTLGRSRKQVTVFTSPPYKWAEDVVYNQINGRLGNTKRSI